VTNPLEVLAAGAAHTLEELAHNLDTLTSGIGSAALEFTQNLGGVLNGHVIAALEKPLPATDPMSAYRYLYSRRQTLIDGARQRPLIRMQDGNYNQLARLGQEMSCRTEEVAADTGEAGVVIRGNDYLGEWVRNAVRLDQDLHLSVDPIGTQPDWPTRWGGKITTINVKRDSSGIHTVELIASANREHLKTILVGSTPWFPPEVQPIKMWMLPANIRTGCMVTLFINLARLYFPGLSTFTNIANPAGWINPLGVDALLNFDPLSWPIFPQFVNPLVDQSRTSILTGAWTNFHDVTRDPLKDAGCTARVYTVFTDDPTNPQPELEALVGKKLADLARPHRNQLMVAFEDHSGADGPTGTAADGPIRLVAKTLDDLITSTVFPVDEDDDGEVDPVFQKLFGVAPKKPWAIYRDGQHSGIIESQYTQHKGPTLTVMTGSKSPRLVNDLQTFAIRWGISQIAQVIPAGPAGAYEAPFVEGLDNCFGGETRYITQNGSKSLEETCGTTQLVLGHQGLWTPAEIKSFGEQELSEVTVTRGRERQVIRATADHDWFRYDGHQMVRCPTNGLLAGDRLVTPKNDAWIVSDVCCRGAREQVFCAVVPDGHAFTLHNGTLVSNCYQGQLDNILLAWERYTDIFRALDTGDMAYQEWLEHPGSSAYTISAVLNLRLGNFKKRAYRSFKTSIRNAAPYIINYDILLDDRVGFEQDGILYADRMSAVRYEYDRHMPITYTVSVGDDSKERDPFSQGVAVLQAVYSLASYALGEGSLF
jgi:hypothetical protein